MVAHKQSKQSPIVGSTKYERVSAIIEGKDATGRTVRQVHPAASKQPKWFPGSLLRIRLYRTGDGRLKTISTPVAASNQVAYPAPHHCAQCD